MSQIRPMNTLSETINLPIVVATLTSVGLHTLIWFYQPLVPMSDKPTAVAGDRRSVKVVQLTPEEILRLPQYAQQTTQPTLPGLPQEQLPTNLLPTLPRAQSQVVLPPPPSFPIYNPSPVTPPTTATPPTTSESNSQTSRSRTRTTVPKSPQDPAKNDRSSRTQQSPQTEVKPTPDSSNSDLPPPTQTNQSSSGLFMGSYERFLAQQNLAPTPENTQTLRPEIQIEDNPGQNNEPTVGNLLDRNRLQPNFGGSTNNQNPNRTGQNATTTDNRNNARNNNEQLVGEARVKAIYGYNAANTTIAQGIENFRQWLDENNQKYGDRLNTKRKPIPDSIRSQFSVQLPDVTPAGIAVLVDPEGKIVGEPKLIRSTGYEQLNQLAIEKVKKRSFDRTGKYEVYQYSIELDQKDLPAVTGAANR